MLYMEEAFTHYRDIYEWGDFPSEIRIKGQITLDMIQDALSNEEAGLPTIGIPVVYGRDQIQSGGMFNKQVIDCLLVTNADHPTDYFKFVFTARTTGAVTTIGVYHCGASAYLGQANLKEVRKNSDFALDRIASIFTRTNNQAMQEEGDYYAMVFDVLKVVFGI